MNKRGSFGGMSKEKHLAIARMGGKAAHAKGTGHEYTAEEAKVAGKKGGGVKSKQAAIMREVRRYDGLHESDLPELLGLPEEECKRIVGLLVNRGKLVRLESYSIPYYKLPEKV